MGEDDQLPPDHPIDVHADRGGQLFDQPLVGGEHHRAVEDRVGDEVPEDEAEIERLVSRMNLQTGEAEVMQTVIETINVGYGGIANYWQDALGLKLDQLQKLRKLYLADDD